jgi:hypothetical protein
MIISRKGAFAAVSALALSVGIAGCSSDDTTGADAGPAAQPGTVNPQSAKASSTTYVGGVSQAVDKNDGQSALGQLIAGAQQAQSIVTPSAGAGTGTRPANVRLADAIGQVSQAITSCDDACTGTTCTFKGCGSDEGGSSIVIDGTLSWTGGNLKCVGLTYAITQMGGTKTTITLDCDVTATAQTLKGTIKSTGATTLSAAQAGANAGELKWSSETTFNDVKYASGKPTSGSVKVSATYSVAGQAYSGSAEVTFP